MARAGDIDYYSVALKVAPHAPDGHVESFLYRGISEEEFRFILRAGLIKSDERFCAQGEGTCFTDSWWDAQSYINFGRDNPGRTGRPTYIIEIPRQEIPIRARDGYFKTSRLPSDVISRVWRFSPGGNVRESARTEHDMAGLPALSFDQRSSLLGIIAVIAGAVTAKWWLKLRSVRGGGDTLRRGGNPPQL